MSGITEYNIELQVKGGEINVTGATTESNVKGKKSYGTIDTTDVNSIQKSAKEVVNALEKYGLPSQSTAASSGSATTSSSSAVAVSGLFDLNMKPDELLKNITEGKVKQLKLTKEDVESYKNKYCYVQDSKNDTKVAIGQIEGFYARGTSSAAIVGNTLLMGKANLGYDGINIFNINEKKSKTYDIKTVNIYIEPTSSFGGSKRHRKTLSKKQPKYKKQKSMRKL